MPQAEERSLPMETAALALTATSPAIACLAMGGVHPLAHAALAAANLLALALLLVERRRAQRPLRWSPLGAPLALGLAATFAALVPLPAFLRTLCDAEGADRLSRVALLVDDEAQALIRPVLAYDPPEAALGALRLIAAVACFAVVTHVATRKRGRRLAYRLVAIGATAVFVVALGHGILDAPVWGRFGGGAGFFHAPLVNPNHLGKVLAFFALLFVGRALSMRRGIEAGALGSLGALCAVGVRWTDSRGSLLALACGGVLLAVLLLMRRATAAAPADSSEPRGTRRALGIAAVVVVVVAVAASTVGAEQIAQLAPLDPEGAAKSKVRVFPFAWTVAREHAGIGTGPGAFGVVLPSSVEPGAFDASRFTWSHVENIALQTAVDHGLVLFALFAVLALAITWHLARSGAAVAAPGATAALAALIAGDLVDFSTELPAGILLVGLALGLIAAKAQPSAVLSTRMSTVALIAVFVVAALTAPTALADWRRALDGELREVAAPQRRAALMRALARHPSDGQFAYELAVDARARRDPRGALRFANRALILWPAHRGAHVEAARALAALGRPDQALIEYRVAWRCGWADAELLAEVLARFPRYNERRQAFPDEPAALVHLCQALRASGSTADAQTCFDDVAVLPGATSPQRGMAVHHAVEHGDVDGALVRVEREVDVDHVASSPRSAPLPAPAAAAAALALEKRDGATIALTRTEHWRFAEPAAFLAWRARAALAAGRDDIVDATLAELATVSRDTTDFLSNKRIHADVLERRGKLAEAHTIVAMLAARAPNDVELWLWKGRLEVRLGLATQAAATAKRAERAWPNDARVRAFLEEIAR